MSLISSDILPSSNARKEKNVLWINTHYFNLTPHNISNTNSKFRWNSAVIKPKYVDISLEFQFDRISDLEFMFTCIKYPVFNSETIPDCYKLQFNCSINVFEEDPKVFELQSGGFKVYQSFLLDASYRDHLKSSDLNKEFEIKVLVKMIEYDCKKNDIFYRQETKFSKMLEIYFKNEPALKDLCYILDIQRARNIFSGHQSDEFAELKTTYIKRVAKFSSIIAEYKKAKNARDPPPLTDFGPILNYVLNGEQKQIDDKDLFEIYFDAHRMGLSVLVHLSRDAILKGNRNQSFVIAALGAADRVGDTFLFAEVAKTFHTIETAQLNPEDAEMLTVSTIEWHFMLRSLNRQLKKKQSESQVEIGESSKSCTIICPTSN